MVALKASLIWRNHGYIGVSSSRKRMVRGNGSARAETGVKATARPNTIRITMRRDPLRDTRDDDLSTITSSPFATSVALAQERSFRRPACGYCISVELRKRGWLPAETPLGRLLGIRQLELSMMFTW